MKIKRIIAVLSALSLAAVMSLGAMAIDDTGPLNEEPTTVKPDDTTGEPTPAEANTTVGYNAFGGVEYYEVVIPYSVEFNTESGQAELPISVTELRLKSTNVLNVICSNGTQTDPTNDDALLAVSCGTGDAKDDLTYSMAYDGAKFDVGDALEFDAKVTKSLDLTLDADQSPKYADTYTGTLTFTVSVEAVQ